MTTPESQNEADAGQSEFSDWLGSIWRYELPTDEGYYWFRYINVKGEPGNPDILRIVEPGSAFEFGGRHVWGDSMRRYQYGPKIEEPNA